MNTISKLTVLTAFTALTVTTLATATAGADPDRPAAPQPFDRHPVGVEALPGVHYTGYVPESRSGLVTPLGTLIMHGTELHVADTSGRPVLGDPAAATTDAEAAPSESSVEAIPVAAPGEDFLADARAAWNAAGPHTGLAAGTGAAAGGLIGIAVGCPLGAVTGGALTTIVSGGVLTVPGAITGCVVGSVAVGGFGASVGSVAVGLPVGIAVATQKYNDIQAQRADRAAHAGPAQ
ncbi:hypothetical protein [Nocardia grenadensis]|nr:hypothetical protein [Nocardia grenadensis]